MKRLLALVLVASMGAVTVGCDKPATDKKQTTTTETQNGKVVDEKKVTTETKTDTPPKTDKPVTPAPDTGK